MDNLISLIDEIIPEYIDYPVPSIYVPNSINYISKIGKGAYGTIYVGTPVDPDIVIRDIAIKKNYIDISTNFLGSLKELDILIRLKNHPFIIDLNSIALTDPFKMPLTNPFEISLDSPSRNSPLKNNNLRADDLYFVFERCAYDGHTLIYGGHATYPYLKFAIVQLILGVEYIHGKGIIHRDLKPSNLLWYRDGNQRLLKICDFGLSKPITSQEPSSPRAVTSWYRAPEISFLWDDYSIKSDIWSIGCILYEMIAKRAFLDGTAEDNRNIANKILSIVPKPPDVDLVNKINKHKKIILTRDVYHKRRKSFRELINLNNIEIMRFSGSREHGTYDQFLDLLPHLLEIDPDKRYDTTQILNHEYFKGHRDYINQVRERYPPVPDDIKPVYIIKCKERTWAVHVAYTIFNERNKLSWYKNRVVFQALSIFDRYLRYKSLKNKNKIDENLLPLDQGIFDSKYITEIKFIVCIYMSIKYFTTLSTPCSYTDITTPPYQTPEFIKIAKDFELFLLVSVLVFRIYQPTVFEISTEFSFKFTPNEIKKLLIFYGELDTTLGETPQNIFKQFIKEKLSTTNLSTTKPLTNLSTTKPSTNLSTITKPLTNISTITKPPITNLSTTRLIIKPPITNSSTTKPTIDNGEINNYHQIGSDSLSIGSNKIKLIIKNKYVPTYTNRRLVDGIKTSRMQTAKIGERTGRMIDTNIEKDLGNYFSNKNDIKKIVPSYGTRIKFKLSTNNSTNCHKITKKQNIDKSKLNLLFPERF